MAVGSEDQPRQVLVLQPDPAVGGGVVEYIDTMLRFMPPEYRCERFIIGNRSALENASEKPTVAGRIAVTFGDARRLFSALRSGGFDIVMVNPSFNPNSLLRDCVFLLVCRLNRQRNVYVQFHGWQLDLAAKMATSGAARWLLRGCFSQARNIGVLASSIRDSAISLGFDAGRLFIEPVFFPDSMLAAKRQQPQGSLQFLFMSRFIRGKGVYELLEAYSEFLHGRENVRLVLAGDGPEMGGVRRRLQELGLEGRVTLPGYVSGEEKIRLLRSSHVFVLPSHSEGCPASMIEAMASGCAVLVTAVGAIPDLIKPGTNGYVLADASAAAILNGLEAMAADRAALSAMGENNLREAGERYRAGAVVPRIFARVATAG